MKDDAEKGPHYLDETYAEATLGCNPGLGQKVLGVRWEPDSNHLVFDVAVVALFASTLEPTKRNIESTIGQFFFFLTPWGS